VLLSACYSNFRFREAGEKNTMNDPPRRFIKDPTLIRDKIRDARAFGRHEDLKARRLGKLTQARTAPYEGQEYYYVVHGHAGVPQSLIGKSVLVPMVTLRFYCNDGETTSDAAGRNTNAEWPKLMKRLTGANTLPEEFLCQTIGPNQPCQPLLVFPGDLVEQGVYFVCRRNRGDLPWLVARLSTIPPAGVSLLTLINGIISPDAVRSSLTEPINVHWIACRARLNI
jgi:hypothetical protein